MIKRIAYKSGLLDHYHRYRNRRRLTTVMFHRVLPERDPRYEVADPTWTLTNTVFAECLRFFRRHYRCVGLDEVLAARGDRSRLPDHALLITFDDGWADNEEWALPLLKAAATPAVVFVAAAGIGRQELWDECLRRKWRLREIGAAECERIWSAAGGDVSTAPLWNAQPAIEVLITRLARLPATERSQLLAAIWCDKPDDRAQMMSLEQLQAVSSAGIAIGSHGMTHVPMALTPEVRRELQESRNALETMTGRAPRAFSFPHGSFNDGIVRQAIDTGYDLLFTSKPHLVPIRGTGRLSQCIGRINIPSQAICDAKGSFQPELLAAWLFTQAHAPFPSDSTFHARGIAAAGKAC
jgi:peptidoglycan/xylan/chitin deacetylase (PgdA/CDA1 family)